MKIFSRKQKCALNISTNTIFLKTYKLKKCITFKVIHLYTCLSAKILNTQQI